MGEPNSMGWDHAALPDREALKSARLKGLRPLFDFSLVQTEIDDAESTE